MCTEMRKTYRATLSEPRLIFPQGAVQPLDSQPTHQPDTSAPICDATSHEEPAQPLSVASDLPTLNVSGNPQQPQVKKRPREDEPQQNAGGQKQKKKRR